MGRENSSSRRRSGGKNENKKRKSKKEEESDHEEDEQMETDDDSKEEKNEESSKGEDEESGSDSDSDEEEPVIEYMVANRARRGNAGAKMLQLIEETLQEDDFYKSAYGGFAEEDADAEYVSPNQSDDDEVDSDFDRPEDEEEPTSDTEGKVPLDPERKRKKDLLKKNKWVLSRIAGFGVKANVVDDVTQAQLLKEAEKTEKANLESLRR
ncbi:hypothetical protein WR25_15427 [Diploscapter pachys]|uniref:Vps72/YL1 N-terminal domain-containing protein n=1 Tax=Diploscapter pachys TaxID=2018661 RepID=A0A2A2LN62_9BILA|nr:hypothetical protein WR25_15427 [Diploscapter pachys]